jgi:FkbM family methyltransferase
MAHAITPLQHYTIALRDGSSMVVDLRQKMCNGYFYYGCMEHEQGHDTLLSLLLKPGSTYVDVGANVGYYVKTVSQKMGRTGNIYAFEPLPSAWNLLETNAKEASQCTLFKQAVADQPGELPFFVHKSGDMSSLLESRGSTKIIVPVTTLDDALSHLTRMDVLKIDVEGAEYLVLQGATQCIKQHRPVICFEYLPKTEEQQEQMFNDFFAPLDYELFYLQNTTHPSQLLGMEQSMDKIAIPKEKIYLFPTP